MWNIIQYLETIRLFYLLKVLFTTAHLTLTRAFKRYFEMKLKPVLNPVELSHQITVLD